ncbi:hypothetical protein [Nocardia rhizosphaerae]|uniref:Uncharacterized protein n=1 Tax=Nocardia rhizosphaerae TaxID=1691571 RepID=A0ABV8L2K0_9NOCA
MMRHTDHDAISAEALSLRAAVRTVEPIELYDRLAHDCAADPERMAQVMMALAIMVDPAATPDQLAELAQGAAACLTPVDELADMEMVDVQLLCDLHSQVGVLPKGSQQRGAIVDAGWVIRVSESCRVVVPRNAARIQRKHHATVATKVAVQQEYQHACAELSMSHSAAVRWVMDRFGLDERTMHRWGFSMEVAA